MKRITLIVALFTGLFIFHLSAQVADEDKPGKIKKTAGKPETIKFNRSWSVGAYGGVPIVFGDVNPEYLSLGYGLSVQKAFSHSTLVRLSGGMGSAKGIDRKYSSTFMIKNNPALNGKQDPFVDFTSIGYTYFNYKMNYYDINFHFIYNFAASDYRTLETQRLNLYFFGGGGLMLYQTFTDQLDKNGALYDFSTIYNDYINGNITQNDAKKLVADMLDRDYETACDGNPAGAAPTWQTVVLNHIALPNVSGGLGARFRISSKLDFTLEARAHYTNEDLLDGQRWERSYDILSSHNDIFFFGSIGLNYRLGRIDNINWFDNPAAMHYKITLENKRKIALLSSDTDNDGVSDYFDKDLETPEGVKVDAQGKPLDSDGDGVADYQDEEPFSDKGAMVNEKGISIDSDEDGVPDHRDLEPNTPKGKLVNFQGITIAEKGSMSGVSGSAIGFLPAIFFDFDDARLKTEFLSPLSMVAEAMKANPTAKLRIIGYTDKVGSEEYNKALGQRRAQTVADFLIMQGIDSSRLEVISKGSAEPLTDVNTNDAQRLNRRVQFELINSTAPAPEEKKFEEVPVKEE
ncbi:MAG TPA: OmpA family protein [Bacteroidia bacterium]|nr:OmpA family protein [Bacteroidia bacterium]HRS59687.1 OmpA family protein [Bacteroidia bacterium]HRU68608.1 OmpA family protein [Bacteroidia bacterium]